MWFIFRWPRRMEEKGSTKAGTGGVEKVRNHPCGSRPTKSGMNSISASALRTHALFILFIYLFLIRTLGFSGKRRWNEFPRRGRGGRASVVGEPLARRIWLFSAQSYTPQVSASATVFKSRTRMGLVENLLVWCATVLEVASQGELIGRLPDPCPPCFRRTRPRRPSPRSCPPPQVDVGGSAGEDESTATPRRWLSKRGMAAWLVSQHSAVVFHSLL